jgi:putative oxidoreductase
MMNMLLIVLKVVASLAFLAAGVAKLAKAKPLVEQFHDFRLPLEIMYFIGVIELLGAIALWFDVLTLWVFSGLACLMAGALKSHITAKHSVASLLPAAVLLCLCVGAALLANWLG